MYTWTGRCYKTLSRLENGRKARVQGPVSQSQRGGGGLSRRCVEGYSRYMSFCRRRTQFGQQHVEVGEWVFRSQHLTCHPQYGTVMHGQIDNCCKLEHTHTHLVNQRVSQTLCLQCHTSSSTTSPCSCCAGACFKRGATRGIVGDPGQRFIPPRKPSCCFRWYGRSTCSLHINASPVGAP